MLARDSVKQVWKESGFGYLERSAYVLLTSVMLEVCTFV